MSASFSIANLAGRSTRFVARHLRVLPLRYVVGGRFDERSVRIVTSSARSGSTWLVNMLGADERTCVLFEPLHLDHVPAAREAGFTWRTYVRPDDPWQRGETFLHQVFSGRVINSWTAQYMSVLRAHQAQTMIVKFVRANRLLPWLCRRFDLVSPVLLVRHPCAVVASQLKSADWSAARRPEAPLYLGEFPAYQAALGRSSSVEEFLAAAWALDQLPCLLSEPPYPWLMVTYEELIAKPLAVIGRIAAAWGLEMDKDKVTARYGAVSRVTHNAQVSGMSGWRTQLSDVQIRRILDTVHAFGLRYYSDELEPDWSLLADHDLPTRLRNDGTGRSDSL